MITELYHNQNMIGKVENYVMKVLSNYMIEYSENKLINIYMI